MGQHVVGYSANGADNLKHILNDGFDSIKHKYRFSVRIDPAKLKTEQFDITEDDFVPVKVIGVGTFGRVVLVRQKGTQNYYAMKVMKKKYIIESDAVQEINSEKVLLAGVHSNFIVNLHYAFQTEDKLYLVMDYLNGGDLFFHLEKSRKFSEARVRLYVAEIFLALNYLHENSIVHRDLKLENLLLDRDGHCVLTDFGFSKMLDKEKRMTLCGTPHYLAPEMILQDKGYTHKVDLWALGVLMFEMLVGASPFDSENPNDILRKILNHTVRFPRSIKISDSAKDLIKKLLTRDPEKRIGSRGKEEIMKHRFFKSLDWKKVIKREVKPIFVPTVKDVKDTRYIDRKVLRQNVQSTRNVEVDLEFLKSHKDEFKEFYFSRDLKEMSKNKVEKVKEEDIIKSANRKVTSQEKKPQRPKLKPPKRNVPQRPNSPKRGKKKKMKLF